MKEKPAVRPEGELPLRPVTDDDREFLIRIISEVRQDELALTMWNEQLKRLFLEHQLDAQTTHYRAVYPGSNHDIICWKGEPAGRLFIDRGVHEIAILDITVLSKFRRNGIGTALIEALKKDAAASHRTVRIFIESYNPSRRLFERLGFRVVEQLEHNLKFVWTP